MASCSRLRKIVVFSVALLLINAVPGWSAQRLANTAGWVQTPFERNPFLFSSEHEAVQALGSQDILMRRSAVQWFGRWTGTYTEFEVAPDQANCAQLRGQASQIVPSLTGALQEMPDGDSLQAARLLTLLGTSAKSAAPTLCAELVSSDYGDGKIQDNDDSVARAELVNSLAHIWGGTDNVAPALLALMQDREPETRQNAAAAVQYCIKYTFDIFGPPMANSYLYSTPEQLRKWQAKFRGQLIPALAAHVNDEATSVRLAALTSLKALTTYDSADAPWQATEPALGRAIASQDPAIRLAALGVLAYMPADVSPLAASLRSGLHGSQEERNYALAATSHAAQTDRTVTVNAFLPDLASSDLSKRRQAASDIQLAAIPLAVGSFWPGPYPLEGSWNDIPVYGPSSLTQSQLEALAKQRQAEEEAAQLILLAALAKSASDPDHAVRANAASSLEQIGNWTYRRLGHGGLRSPGWKARPCVEKALAEAAQSLQSTEPVLAERLQDLHDKIARGPLAVF